jgi:2-keto-3-deoxy-L-rhamnonate aldolase RhmA
MLNLNRAIDLLERARKGEVLLGMHCSTLSAQAVELAGMSGIDYMVIGMESESVDPSRLEDLLRAGEVSGQVTMVKVRRPKPELVEDALTAGANFVTVPHITSGEQLHSMIKAAQFSGHGGNRGCCAIARYIGYGTMAMSTAFQACRTYNPVIPIIEDKEAIDNIDEILEVNKGGIIEIGPYDLSMSLGIPNPAGYLNKEVLEAIDLVWSKAKERGSVLLAPVWYPPNQTPKDQAKFMHENLVSRGIRLIYDGDLYLMKRQIGQMALLREVAKT